MLIPTNFNRCILCLINPPNSKEHIFPESIGGRLQAQILCASCNNNRCSAIANTIQNDSWYLTALSKLKEELPDLHKQTFFQYANRASDGTVIKSSKKNGRHQVATHSAPDGTITSDEKVMPEIIRGILSKEGFDKSEIQQWEKECLHMPTNTDGRLPNGNILKKREGPPLIPKFNDNCLCTSAAMLIGYEFLALMVGNYIYDDSFSYIREFLKTEQTTERIYIEKFHVRNYRPQHEIDFVQNGRKLTITVRFLGASVYRIALSEFLAEIKDTCFVEDINGKRSLTASSHEEARKGNLFPVMNAFTRGT